MKQGSFLLNQDLDVIKDDYTFAKTVEGGEPFGVAFACAQHDGQGNYLTLASMKLDLTGTGFALDESVGKVTELQFTNNIHQS